MEKVKILKAVDIINDSVSEYEGERPFLSTGDLNLSTITNLELHTFSEKPSRANQNVSSGDLILARMQGTVKVKLINNEDENIIVSTGFLVLRPKINADSKYLFHLLKSSNFQNDKDKLCTGATQKAINNSNFEKLEIPLPNLATQQRIAAILDQSDAIIQNNRAIVQKYDALTQSLFLDMFGDPVKNEKGWEKKKLGIITNMKAGKFIAASDIFAENSNEMFPCYGGNGLRGFVKSNTHEGEFVLIGRQGALCGNVKVTNGKFHATEHAIVCSPIMKYQTLWLYYLLKMMNLNRFATGAAQPGLNVGTLVDLEIMIVPYDIQTQFAERVAVIESQKQQAQLELAKSEELFQSLLQRAFKGELS